MTASESDGARASSAAVRARACLELTKPGITGFVTLTAAVGYLVGAAEVEGLLLLHLMVGTALAAGGTNALNQVLERDADARMERTRDRPLPSGRLSTPAGAAFAVASSAAGVVWLLAFTDPLTASLAAATVFLYAVVYTPLKKRSWTALLVGAVPGALPALGGWTAARGEIGPTGVFLFLVLFLWQLPHFLGLDWLHRRDYGRAGFRTLAVESPDGRASRTGIVGSLALLLGASLGPWLGGPMGFAYGGGALVLGGAFLASGLVRGPRTAPASGAAGPDRTGGRGPAGRRRAEDREGPAGRDRPLTRAGARRVFLASLLYLPLLLVLMVADRFLI